MNLFAKGLFFLRLFILLLQGGGAVVADGGPGGVDQGQGVEQRQSRQTKFLNGKKNLSQNVEDFSSYSKTTVNQKVHQS